MFKRQTKMGTTFWSGQISILDFIIFFGTIIISLSIGVFFGCKGRKKTSIVDYFLAGRKLTVLPTAFSLVVTYQSSLMIIGAPAEVYAYGLKYAYLFLGAFLSFTFAGFTIVPVFHPLKLTSVYSYFELRYKEKSVRYVLMASGMLSSLLYMGTVTFGTCVALEVILGIPQWASILIYTIVTTIYTSLGGMKAVIWTDVFQLLIMFTGVFAVIIKCTTMTGGIDNVIRLASSRLQMDDFRVDPTIRYQFWNLTFGSLTVFFVSLCQQPGIQRINSSPDLKSAKWMCAVAGALYVILSFLICTEGVMMYAYYDFHKCDPLASGRIDSSNKLVPLIVADLFGTVPGLPGLFIASLSSAALSTLSSCLSSLGAITYDDFVKVLFPNLTEKKATSISKCIVATYGLLAMVFAICFSKIPGTIMNVSFAIMACVDGPVCAAFLLAVFARRSTGKGVMVGAVCGALFTLWLNLNQIFHPGNTTTQLPPASIENCPADGSMVKLMSGISGNLSLASSLAHDYLLSNVSSVPAYQTTIPSNISGSNAVESESSSFLHYMSSLSYMSFSVLGCTLTIIIATIVSCFTKPPEHLDDIYLFSFDKHIRKVYFPNKSKQYTVASTPHCKGEDINLIIK